MGIEAAVDYSSICVITSITLRLMGYLDTG